MCSQVPKNVLVLIKNQKHFSFFDENFQLFETFYEVEKYFDSLLKVFVVVTEYSLMNCLL